MHNYGRGVLITRDYIITINNDKTDKGLIWTVTSRLCTYYI